jgi:hypothetical protein
MSTKVATIFDHLSHITEKKTPWDKLSEADQKSFSPYLINRWLSMNMDLIEIVDMFQQYTIGELDRKHVYQLYQELLPKRKMYNKYIKGKDSDKYNKELLEFIAKHYQVSIREATEYVAMMLDMDKESVVDILRKYGKTDKEIKSLMK